MTTLSQEHIRNLAAAIAPEMANAIRCVISCDLASTAMGSNPYATVGNLTVIVERMVAIYLGQEASQN